MAVDFGASLAYYKRSDVRDVIVRYAQRKEIGILFDFGFGKRPDSFVYVDDVLEAAKNKATSFHCSEELWSNPLQLSSTLKRSELDDLRTGWDLVLDIDCHVFEYSKIAAYYTIRALQESGIDAVTCKFSGNKGFHIAVPFEAFPDRIGDRLVRHLFPEAPRRIAAYVKSLIMPSVGDAIVSFEKGDVDAVCKKTALSFSQITKEVKDDTGRMVRRLDVDPFLVIDTVLIASRHLYRMPFSLHEKSGLVSVPVAVGDVLTFTKQSALPSNIRFDIPFLDRQVVVGQAARLVTQAYDDAGLQEAHENRGAPRVFEVPESAIPSAAFPPCMHNMFKGMQDGKKRSLFALVNFLYAAGWSAPQVEDIVRQWNEKNAEPLRETYWRTQLSYAARQKERNPPPNCTTPGYYKDCGICAPDSLCAKIRNPLQYAKRRAKLLNQVKPKARKKSADLKKDSAKGA
ncbi:MAG: DNA primase small subunit domain-containing protein [Nanoarchaeota archaeon]